MSPRSRNMLLSSAFMLLGFVGLSRIGAQGAIPPHFPLSNFPDRVGEWTGVRLPMDEKTKALLNADSYSSILFTNTPGTPGILFFSIYYDRQTPEKKHPLPGELPSFVRMGDPFPPRGRLAPERSISTPGQCQRQRHPERARQTACPLLVPGTGAPLRQ